MKTLSTGKKQNAKAVIVIAAMTMLTSACGNSSKDPMAKYKDLEADVPLQENIVRDQKLDICAAVVVTAPTMVVTQGKKATQEVLVRGALANKTAALSINHAPKGMTISRTGNLSDGEARFILSYTPERGTIDMGNSFASAEIELVPQITSAAAFIQCPERVGIVVTRDSNNPVITKVTAAEEINLDAKVNPVVTVDVKSEGIEKRDQLVVYSTFDESANSKENAVLDLTQALRRVSVGKEISANTYRFQYEISLEVLRVLLAEKIKNDPKVISFEMLTQLTAVNREAELESPSQNLVIKVVRTLPAEVAK